MYPTSSLKNHGFSSRGFSMPIFSHKEVILKKNTIFAAVLALPKLLHRLRVPP